MESSIQMTRRWVRQLGAEELILTFPRRKAKPGRAEQVIQLSERGIKSVAQNEDLRPSANSMPCPENSEHTLAINDFRVLLSALPSEFSWTYLTSLTLLQSPELRFSVPVRPQSEATKTLLPDAVFLLRREAKTLLYFLEVDCGTEPLRATKEGATDVQEKIDHYRVLRGLNLHRSLESQAGASLVGFRVLFVSMDPKRHQVLCSLVRETSFGSFFWLSELETLQKVGLLGQAWNPGGVSSRTATIVKNGLVGESSN